MRIGIIVFTFILVTLTSLFAQNGEPHQVWSEVYSLSPNASQEVCYNLLVIQDFIYYSSINSNNELKLVQMNKFTRQIGWQRLLNGFDYYTLKQLASTPDNNIAVIDSNYILRKISIENGIDIWSLRLAGLVWLWQDCWTIASTPNGIVCRGNKGALVFVNNEGQVYSANEEVQLWILSYGFPVHEVIASSNEVCYLYQDENYYESSTQLWKDALSVGKISSEDYSSGYNENWSFAIRDESFPKLSVSNGNLYLSSIYTDYENQEQQRMRIRRIEPDTGDVVWVQNIGGIADIAIEGLIPNGPDVIAYGFRFSNLHPLILNYNAQGIQTWSYEVPLPEGEQLWAIYEDAVWDNNMLIMGGNVGGDYGCDIWLSGISTSVSNYDLTVPVIIPELTCYPNPSKGSFKIKFDQTENCPTTISIYNIKGQLVRTLLESTLLTQGEHKMVWDRTTDCGQLVSAGIYILKMTSSKSSITKKLILLR